ncbi:MAG: hypothetical protein JWO03_927 [Bacteroidetes bacterium]|nr:hypothetical protein [Bacteroidota bacterium]
MKKVFTWVAIAALLAVKDGGFMQDQDDTSVNLLGEHMDAINTALVDANTAKASVAGLTTRATTAEAAVTEAHRLRDEAVNNLATLQATLDTANADLATRTQELAAANVALSKRPPATPPIIPGGPGGPDAKTKFEEFAATLPHNKKADEILKKNGA